MTLSLHKRKEKNSTPFSIFTMQLPQLSTEYLPIIPTVNTPRLLPLVALFSSKFHGCYFTHKYSVFILKDKGNFWHNYNIIITPEN